MDNWERFDEITLPDKEAFYSNLNMEGITDMSITKLIMYLKNLN